MLTQPNGTTKKSQTPAQPQLEKGPLPLIWRGEVAYEEARVGRVFNQRRPQRFPVAVLNAISISDVIRGVNLARQRNLKIAIRSGGHSWAAWSVRQQSLLIDLKGLRELSFDPDTNIATVSPSITGGELNPYLAKYGRFFAGGHCPTVGLGGFLLQGGQGWAARGWGWSCEQIESMDVVLASGELVTASETENSDLFWAARGSGPGFFGIVVRFRLKTRWSPLAMHHSTFIFPAKAHVKEVLCWLQRIAPKVDPAVELVCLAFTRGRLFPDTKNDPTKDPMESMTVLRATALVDTDEQAHAVLEFMGGCPGLEHAEVAVHKAQTSLAQEHAQQLADNPEGRYFNDNAWLSGSSEDVADSLELAFTSLPSSDSFFLYYSMAPLRPLPDMAFDIQTEHYAAGYIIARSEDTSEDERCAQWLTDRYAYIVSKKAGSGGSAGQYLGDSDWTRRRDKIMSDKHFIKWCEIRDRYDADSRFAGFLTREEHLAAVSGLDSKKTQVKVAPKNTAASVPEDPTSKQLLY